MAKELSMASFTIFFLLALLQILQLADAQVGVCYGKAYADNLPPVEDVIHLYNRYGIKQMRIYDSDQEVLKSVYRCSHIKLMIGVVNEDIISMGSDPLVATQWVHKYVLPYWPSIKYIAVGNEVPLDNPQAQFIEPAMQNLQKALNSCYLGGRIKVSTAISQGLMKNPSTNPSDTVFTNITFMKPIVNFLVSNDSPLFLNILAYVDYSASADDIGFILFTLHKPYLTDTNTGLQYLNQYDAVMDGLYAALGKIEALTSRTKQTRNASPSPSAANSEVIIEGGAGPQPPPPPQKPPPHKKPPHKYYTNGGGGGVGGGGTNGGDGIVREYGETYYRNLLAHLKEGTPMRPKEHGDVFLFEMFDENQKPGDPSERHLGLFTAPDKCPKYDLTYS